MQIFTSDLTSCPTWLDVYGGQTGKTEGVDFGFDGDGMWFTGDAGGESYSVRTNWSISSSQSCEITYTVDHNESCSDHGICFYNHLGLAPVWDWGGDPSRIAFQINCPIPYIYGINKVVNNDGERPSGGENNPTNVLSDPNYYTFKITYDPPSGTVTAVTHLGQDTNGVVVDTIVLHEVLPNSPLGYRIGFDADQDNNGTKSYFKNLTITYGCDSTYELDLSPDNPESIPNYKYEGEGNLDTAIIVDPITGKRRSIQRSGYFELVDNCGNRKVVSAKDGDQITSASQTWADALGAIIKPV